jgi:hypothetical protein
MTVINEKGLSRNDFFYLNIDFISSKAGSKDKLILPIESGIVI